MELQTKSVSFNACGMERIRFSSAVVMPFETSAEYPPIKLTPTVLPRGRESLRWSQNLPDFCMQHRPPGRSESRKYAY